MFMKCSIAVVIAATHLVVVAYANEQEGLDRNIANC